MAQTIVAAARIAAVLATAPSWTAARRKSDGRPFFYIAGSTVGSVYMTDATACTCPAAQRYSGPCKHSQAVAQHLASKAKAEPAAKPARPSYADLFPVCVIDGCDEEAGRKGGLCIDHAIRSQRAA